MMDSAISSVPVDRTARDQAVAAIRRFLNGEISNREYEQAYPESADPAIHGIWVAIWGFYDDNWEHRLVKRHALTHKGRILFERCILFLRTDYPWPHAISVPWWRKVLAIILLPLLILWPLFWLPMKIITWRKSRHPHPEESFWPFQTEEEYQKVVHQFE